MSLGRFVFPRGRLHALSCRGSRAKPRDDSCRLFRIQRCLQSVTLSLFLCIDIRSEEYFPAENTKRRAADDAPAGLLPEMRYVYCFTGMRRKRDVENDGFDLFREIDTSLTLLDWLLSHLRADWMLVQRDLYDKVNFIETIDYSIVY